LKAAEAWSVVGDMARCAENVISGAEELDRGGLHSQASPAFTQGVRIFVPDEFNKMSRFGDGESSSSGQGIVNSR